MLVYPNPSKDHLFIRNSSSDILQAQAQDLLGRIFDLEISSSADSDVYFVDTKALSSGIYFLIVDRASDQSVSKIIIE